MRRPRHICVLPASRKTLLRSGGRRGPKEPDPDTPPHVGFTHANIRSRLSTRFGSIRCRLRVHARTRACTLVNFKKNTWEFSL